MAARPITILKRPTTAPTPEDDEESFTLVTRARPKKQEVKQEVEDEVQGRADVKQKGPVFRFPTIKRLKEISKSGMATPRYRDDVGRIWVQCIAVTASEDEAQFMRDILAQWPPGALFYWTFKKKDNSYASVHPEVDPKGLTLTSLAICSHVIKDAKHVVVLANGAAESKPGSRERKVSYAVVAVRTQ
jgi:hypothetical protein